MSNDTACTSGYAYPQSSYTGTKSTTFRGYTCQYWNATSPHDASSTGFSGYGNNNYCRNSDYPVPWCYTTDPNVPWDFCFQPEDTCGGKHTLVSLF